MTDKQRNAKIISFIILGGIVYLLWGNVKYHNKVDEMEKKIEQLEQNRYKLVQKVDLIETK
jgi:hypothetical protein